MCGGDDHLAWKHPISQEACRRLRTARGYDRLCQGSFKVHPSSFRATLTLQVEPQILRSGFPFLHMGASEGFQSLFSYSSNLVLPQLVSSCECLEISMSLNYSWTTFLLCIDLFLSVQISISSMFSLCRALSRTSCSSGLALHSQCGFTILGQSRGQIGLRFP